MKHMQLAEVASLVDGTVFGDTTCTISRLVSLELAEETDLTFLVKAKDGERLRTSRAAAALVPIGYSDPALSIPLVEVQDPYLASARIHNHLLAEPFTATGIHPRAHIGEGCVLHPEVSIGPMVVVGNRVTIGARVTIEAGSVIGDDVEIGDDSLIKANVTIGERCRLGRRVIIHSGTVIGSDGYGYATTPTGEHVKRPHVGSVRIDDEVEIGSNVSVDRGAFDDTWIQSGTKIDNQVQVAHNVVIGPNCLIVAQVGLAGSCSLGRNVVLGGKAAIKGHIHLEDQVMVAAGGGVHTSLPAGAKVGGFPAIGVGNWAKASAIFAKLPELYAEFRKMKKLLSRLESKMPEQDR